MSLTPIACRILTKLGFLAVGRASSRMGVPISNTFSCVILVDEHYIRKCIGHVLKGCHWRRWPASCDKTLQTQEALSGTECVACVVGWDMWLELVGTHARKRCAPKGLRFRTHAKRNKSTYSYSMFVVVFGRDVSNKWPSLKHVQTL